MFLGSTAVTPVYSRRGLRLLRIRLAFNSSDQERWALHRQGILWRGFITFVDEKLTFVLMPRLLVRSALRRHRRLRKTQKKQNILLDTNAIPTKPRNFNFGRSLFLHDFSIWQLATINLGAPALGLRRRERERGQGYPSKGASPLSLTGAVGTAQVFRLDGCVCDACEVRSNSLHRCHHRHTTPALANQVPSLAL